jgi:AcrR family transcriptional regulator
MNTKGTARSPTRRYQQVTRARNAKDTGRRILAAFEQCFHDQWFDEITLEEVATRAGVAVRTVIRRFGSKSGLLGALVERMVPQLRARRATPPGDVPKAVQRILAVYEEIGDGVVRNLAQEARIPELQPLIEIGRKEHRAVTARTYAAWLSRLNAVQARRVLDALVVATDVYTWKLLRRDMGRSIGETKTAILQLIDAILRSSVPNSSRKSR